MIYKGMQTTKITTKINLMMNKRVCDRKDFMIQLQFRILGATFTFLAPSNHKLIASLALNTDSFPVARL